MCKWRRGVFNSDSRSCHYRKRRVPMASIYFRYRYRHLDFGARGKSCLLPWEHGEYALKSFIKQMVQFSQDDLTSQKTVAPAESVFGTFDIVLCRNVLIYFSRELQSIVFSKLYRSLTHNGYLILGEAETLNNELTQKFNIIDHRNRIFQKVL